MCQDFVTPYNDNTMIWLMVIYIKYVNSTKYPNSSWRIYSFGNCIRLWCKFFHFYIEKLISSTISIIFLVSSVGIAFILK